MADRPAGGAERQKKPKAWAQIFASRRMAITAALGFASGLPILFTSQILTLWLTDNDLSIGTIGLFLWVSFPYTIKFLWAPLLDRFAPPLGRRRGWILISQIGLVAIVAAMGSSDPSSSLWTVAILTFILAILGATQDVAIDAWRADILTPDERAAGSAVYVFGYRAALLVIGTGGLILADVAGYRALFLGAAALLGLCIIATVLAEEPTVQTAARPHSLAEMVVLPFSRLFKKLGPGLAAALAFAAFYKFGDQMVDGLIGTFWRRELELTKTEIGTITKFSGTIGVVLGGVLAGILTPRLGTKRALILFGVLQASTNFLYLALALLGKEFGMIELLVGGSIFVDYVAGTMGTAVFMAVFIAMCDKEVSATQYALLTSLSGVGKRVFGPLGGMIIAGAGWPVFFTATAAMAIPGLILVWFLPRILLQPPHKPEDAEPDEPAGKPSAAPAGGR